MDHVAEVEVEDRGLGLSADDRARIFEPFYSTKEHGMGMGLPISMSIIRSHHGELAVDEADAQAQYTQVDTRAKRIADGSDFLAVAPMGQVPALKTDDGTVLTENTAVLQYPAKVPVAELLDKARRLTVVPTRREVDTLSLDGSPSARTAEEVEATALQATDRGPSPLADLESRELGSAIELAIGKLRPEYRACILLRHVEGRAYEEIADALDLPLGTVKTYIHRARLELRDLLGHLKDD